MSGSHSRIHEQIVELISKAHTDADTMESKIQALQQATELLLFHTSGNERVDEFLETFLSMHVSRDVPLRRFCAHFIELLCFTRSRFACSSLEVLVSLLQDQDKQVQIFALRAARVVYKRALYWISVQQREAMFVPAARESVDTLDHVLARIVHLITSSNREVFCEAIRCAQSIVLSQSFSNFAAKSQAQLESVGGSCLEDLRLVDTSALDESKLKGQADRLFTALCALLVKKREDSSSEIESIALINAVGLIGHERGSYAGAATVGFTQLVEELGTSKREGRLGAALVTGLKRILSSRHCISWQPRIIPVLARLGIVDPTTMVDSTGVVMDAELERMRQQVEPVSGSLFEQQRLKRRKLNPGENGERLMMISDIADSFKVPDEEHAVAICSVRAQNPAELAKLALAMLSRLPKKFDDHSAAAIIKVNRGAAGASTGQSIGFENRVKAVRSMGITDTDFLDGDLSDEEGMDIVTPAEPEEPSNGKANVEYESDQETSVDFKSLIDLSQVDLFCKLFFSLRIARDEKINLVYRYIAFHVERRSTGPISKLILAAFAHESDISVADIGACLIQVVTAPEQNILLSELKPMILELPIVPENVLDYLDSVARSVEGDVSVRRNALTALSALFFSRPGLAGACLHRLVDLCACDTEEVRNDALKLVVAKVYKPLESALSWQWPYSDACPLEVVKSLTGKVSQMDLFCSQTLETVANERLTEAVANSEWNKAWLFLALCSKKPFLIHSVLGSLVESGEASLPADMMKSFGQTLTVVPAQVIDHELEVAVKRYQSIRAAAKKKARNDFLLPILSAISTTDRGLTSVLAAAALSFRK